MNLRLPRYSFYIIWVLVSIIQASFTELFHDEAYYWKFSQELAWGYFDHPPIIAILIRIGNIIIPFQNELSVRLLMIVLNTGTIYLVEKIVNPKNLWLFYALVSSTVFFHIGFLAIPDTPLLFFTALFFYYLPSYLEKDYGNKSILILSVIITLLLYSKYHGILVIFFTIIANPGIVKRKSFYMIVLLSLVLYMPHIYWQYQNDFVSLKYHLFDRSLNSYSFSNTIEYLFPQLIVIGGLSGVLLFYFSIKHKSITAIENTFKWNLTGILIFFLAMTFKGRVETNWTSIALVPIFALSFKYIETNANKISSLLYKLSFISIGFIIILRTYLIYDFTNDAFHLNPEIHKQKIWANQIKEASKGEHVIFMNSYQKAAKYEFYSGIPSYSLNNVWGRKNQFSLKFEEDFIGKRIFLIYNNRPKELDSFNINNEWLSYRFIDNFVSYSKIKLIPDTSLRYLEKNKDVTFKLFIRDNILNQSDFEINKSFPSYLSYQFFYQNEMISNTQTPILLSNDMMNGVVDFRVHTPEKEGNYVLNISISTGYLPPTINSDNIKITVQ